MPVSFSVKIRPNREIITPLSIGTVQYDYPTAYQTNQISEIVVINAPLNFSRYGALFGKPSDVSVQYNRTAPEGNLEQGYFKPAQETTTTYSTPATSVLSPVDQSPFLYDYTLDVQKLKTFKTETLDQGSSIYYPQLDFYPRYNQWFASTSWPKPNPSILTYPEYYDVMLVYAERETKTIYYTYGTANLTLEGAEPIATNPVTDSIIINSAAALEVPNGATKNLILTANVTVPAAGVYNLKWRYTMSYQYFSSTISETFEINGVQGAASAGPMLVNFTKVARAPLDQMGLSTGVAAGNPIEFIVTGANTSNNTWFTIA